LGDGLREEKKRLLLAKGASINDSGAQDGSERKLLAFKFDFLLDIFSLASLGFCLPWRGENFFLRSRFREGE
jgi:hypothetical protein